MILLRSLLFNVVFVVWTAALGVVFLPLLACPPRVIRRAGAWWSRTVLALARAICGIRWEVRGLENVPPGRPCIFAAKHQSAWDTLFFPAFFVEIAALAKSDLRFVPFYGWYAWHAGTVWIDRRAGAAALRVMIRGALDALKDGRHVFVFPQGTRTLPGERRGYQPGVAGLYAGTGAPVVPVALNSGLHWGRRAFRKRPGTIVVEFLPPVARGLDRDAFLDALARAIEPATRRLEAAAVDKSVEDGQDLRGGFRA